jgi:hypothetical protein
MMKNRVTFLEDLSAEAVCNFLPATKQLRVYAVEPIGG